MFGGKKSKAFKIFWAILSILMVLGMIFFTIAPGLGGLY